MLGQKLGRQHAYLRRWSPLLLVLGSFWVPAAEACGGEGEPKCRHGSICNSTAVAICLGVIFGVPCLLALILHACGCCTHQVTSAIRRWRSPAAASKHIHKAPSVLPPSDSVSSVQGISASGLSRPGNLTQGPLAPVTGCLADTNRRDSNRGGQRDLPLSGRYIGTCMGPSAQRTLMYMLEFHQDGSVSGTCTEVGSTPLQVSGGYDPEAQLYRWAELTDRISQHCHEESDLKDYTEALMESGLWHAEVEMRVHSRGKLEGQYFTTRGTYGSLGLEAMTE